MARSEVNTGGRFSMTWYYWALRAYTRGGKCKADHQGRGVLPLAVLCLREIMSYTTLCRSIGFLDGLCAPHCHAVSAKHMTKNRDVWSYVSWCAAFYSPTSNRPSTLRMSYRNMHCQSHHKDLCPYIFVTSSLSWLQQLWHETSFILKLNFNNVPRLWNSSRRKEFLR